MEQLWKGIGICLLTCILIIITGKQNKDIALILSIAGTIAVSAISVSFLTPVIDYMKQLSQAASFSTAHLNVLMKATGVGLVAELAATVCSDSGNSSLGNVIRLMSSAVILWLSVPVFQALMKLIGSILGEI